MIDNITQQIAHAGKVSEFLEGQSRIEQVHLSTFDVHILHHDTSTVYIDLSAISEAYFTMEIAKQAFEQGLAAGRRQKVEEFRKALTIDGEEE